jgi:putative ABC transport system permease protein
MSSRGVPRWAELLLGIALKAHPRAFRARYGAEMRAYFRDTWQQLPGSTARLGHLVRSVASSVSTGLRQRIMSSVPGEVPELGASDVWRLDLKHAVRGIVRRPALGSLVVLALALGVGANAAVFGTLYSVVLAPLPYAESDRLVRLYQYDAESPSESSELGGYLTLPAATHYREHARTLAALAPVYTYSPEGVDLTGVGRPERLRVMRIGADYFDVLGVRPQSGRGFRRDEERADARVIIVSAATAERIGETAVLDGVTYDVVGVMPSSFEDPLMGAIDVWLPLDLPTGGYETWQWDNHYLSAIARLAPGRTLGEAQAEIEHISRLQGEFSARAADFTGQLVPLHGDVVGQSETLLAMLMGAVGLLLLLTLVNVSVLLVALSLDRSHEIAVRTALGSPRSRLARQYLFEGTLLAVAGSAAGALVAVPLQRVLVATAPAGALDRAAVAPLWPILLFGLLAALVAGAVFGITPLANLRRVDPTGALRQGGRGTDSRFAGRIREGLVITQVAMALVLLIGAGVLVKSFERMRSLDLNLRATNVLTFEANLPAARYEEVEAQRRFREELGNALAARPEIRAVGAISRLPVTGRAFVWGTRKAVGENEAEGNWVPADQRVVSGNVFEVLGIPLIRGRTFGPQDDANAPPRIVTNEAHARAMFGSAEAAIGQGVRIGGARREVIGVVADVPVTVRGEVAPMVYHTARQFSQFWSRSLVHLVATEPRATNVLAGITADVARLDAELVVFRPRELADVIGTGRGRELFAARLLTAFAGLAVGLSALGLYGILAHAVRRRRREIGIRLALGAEPRSVLGMIVRQGLGTAVIGVAIGVAGAWIATRALVALVFGVEVRDPTIFAGAAAAMLAVAAVASALPAMRATRVRPVETFRTE